jgi:hypothetical protein
VVSDSEVKTRIPDGAELGVIELATPSGNAKSPISFLVAY